MELAPLHCPVCGSVIPGKEVHLALSVARCLSCSAVFDLAGRTPSSQRPPPRAQVPLPPIFQVEDKGYSGLTVSWRWFKAQALFLAFFCIFWDGFLLVWYGVALGSEETPLMMVLFPLGHVAVGAGLTYWTVAQFVNRTWIEASRNRLVIRHGPLRWKANLDLAGSELVQLYGREEIHRGKNGVSVSYSLNAIDRKGTQRKLLMGLTEVEQVLWLEQALERQLGIGDRPVDGEVARRTG